MFSAFGISAFAKEKSMTRLGSLVLCAGFGLGVALVGCGSSTSSGPSVLDLVPRDNTVSGWTVDPSDTNLAKGKVAATATTQDEATTGLSLDGASEPFYKGFAPVIFAMQNYVNTSMNAPDGYNLKLFIVQMTSADQAASLYATVITDSLYTANTWQDPTSPLVGTGSRITDTGNDWWINFYKGVYYVQVLMSHGFVMANGVPEIVNGAPVPDAQSQPAAMAFAQAVAAKM
jgi:hypothetical protein